MNKENEFLNFIGIGKKAGYLEEGYNKTEKEIINKKIFIVFISKDLSMNSKKKFYNYASKYNVTIIEDAPMEKIGAFLGNPSLKVLGFKDFKFCKNLKSLYNKGKKSGGE